MTEFRDIRRTDKAKDREFGEQLLRDCSDGIMSVYGENGYPYGVPVNHVYLDGVIYFHCAQTGHKIDAINANPNVCFTVIGSHDFSEEKRATYYSSAVCFGKARIVEEGTDEKLKALNGIVEKFCKGFEEGGYDEVNWNGKNCHIIAIDIDHMTAKANEPKDKPEY